MLDSKYVLHSTGTFLASLSLSLPFINDDNIKKKKKVISVDDGAGRERERERERNKNCLN